jgi:hypothetical protein
VGFLTNIPLEGCKSLKIFIVLSKQPFFVVPQNRNKDMDRKCKITTYNVHFKNILLYGAEIWTCTKRRVNYKLLR